MDKPTILLVDDVDFFLEVEKGYLKQTYAEVATARNGQEALDFIAKKRPDLIFMDVNMPVMNGIECCKQIKADSALKTIPVVIVYATSKEVNDSQVSASGCDGYIHKPVDRKEFLEIGRQFLPKVDRRHRRVACEMSVDINQEGVKLQGRGFNVSATGMYVEYKNDIQAGARIKLSFFLPTVSPTPVETWAEVSWVNQGFPRTKLNLPQGFGVEFKLTSEENKEIINTFIEQIPEDAHVES